MDDAPGSAQGQVPGADRASRGAGCPARSPSPFAVFSECPLCGAAMVPEHAHYRCTGCGWRDSCCD